MMPDIVDTAAPYVYDYALNVGLGHCLYSVIILTLVSRVKSTFLFFSAISNIKMGKNEVVCVC